MDGVPKQEKITTIRSRAVKLILADGTTVIIRRAKSGKTSKKTTVKVKGFSEVTVTAIDE